MNEDQTKPWFKNWWGVIVVTLILPFFAIWYVWAKTNWSKTIKWVVTGVLTITFIIVSISGSRDSNNTANNQSSAEENKQALNYEISDKSFVGTTANITVITTETDTSKLIAINDEVFDKYKSGKTHVFINYFDDKTIASSYFDKIADLNTSEAESKTLSRHYIANMKYNESSGLKKLFKNDGGDNWTDIKSY